MPRSKFRKITTGNYSKCFLCDYELKNNKIGMKLHFRHSHPNEVWNNGEKDRLVCAVCKKPDCKMH